MSELADHRFPPADTLAILPALVKAVGEPTAERPLGATPSDSARLFVPWRLQEDFIFERDALRPYIMAAVSAVKKDSSPGYPLRRYVATNEQAIESYLPEIIDSVTERLLLLSEGCPTSVGPRELVSRGYRDLVCPFIKNELHPPRKARYNKWRIVQSVSLVDQLVERVLYSLPVMALKIRYPRSDAVVGIGFTDNMTEEFYSVVISDMTADVAATDVSGWDRTIGASFITEAAESLIRSCQNPSAKWVKAIRAHVHGLVNPAFLVPEKGQYGIYTRNAPGGMLSGSYLTTTFNTLARLDVSRLVGSLRCKAAGDDALELFPPGMDAEAAYRKLGFTLRVEPRSDGFEFCSHLYRHKDPRSSPLTSWKKAVANYFTQVKPTPQQAVALRHELRHNEELSWLDPLIDESLENA